MSADGKQSEIEGCRVNTALRFYHEILGLDALHYGLWKNDAFNMEGLKIAQQRYTDHLLSYFPTDVKTVLDVGAGTGATSEKLQARGYDVEALSPDPYQKHLFEKKCHVFFHLAKFQNFSPKKKYDLVLMSESCQYIPIDGLFTNAKRCAPNGYLLINDYFITCPDNTAMSKSGHNLDVFFKKAHEHNFKIIKEEDITDQAAVSLELARSWVDRYVLPSIDLMVNSYRHKHPKILAVLRWLFHSKIKKFNDALMLLDANHFKRVKRYKILLFRVPE